MYLYYNNYNNINENKSKKTEIIDNTNDIESSEDINNLNDINKQTIKLIDNTPIKGKTNIIYSNNYEDNYFIEKPPLYQINKNLNRLINPLLPPERSNPYTTIFDPSISKLGTGIGVPINISTRGDIVDYSQVGVLTNNSNNKNTILPLFGKQTYPGSNKWLYYTSTDKYNSIKLPINFKNRNCSNDIGCDEITENDELNVPAYNSNFKVTIYNIDKPRYIPYI